MQLSKDTLSIFKNFATINSNLTIKPGNKLVTISSGKNIIAEAEIADSFPQEFGIYDLNEFLGIISIFETPALRFDDKSVFIHDASKPVGKNGVKYFAASATILTPVPNVKPFPSVDVEFDISGSMLSQIQRVASILKVTDFSVIGDGDTITIQVGDKANATGNSFHHELGVTDKKFRVNLKVENLRLMPADYNVSIGGKKICRFTASNHNHLVYLVAAELDSTFDF